MEKIAFYTENEARQHANGLCENGAAYIKGIITVNCSSFDTPREVDQWQGEINAFNVVSCETYETVALVAYWE